MAIAEEVNLYMEDLMKQLKKKGQSFEVHFAESSYYLQGILSSITALMYEFLAV